MAVPKDEWIAFQQSGVRAELDNDIKEVMAGIASEIVNRERPDADRDQYLRGFLHGLRTIYEWTPDLINAEDTIEDD